jgi:hypothetical protein
MSGLPVWGFVLIVIVCIAGGLVGGFFIARSVMRKQIKDNPPFNRDMIKAMYRSMGRTPSESQVNATMRAIEEAQKKSLR